MREKFPSTQSGSGVLDGLVQNQGVLTIATTNHPERIDDAILNRPSRFDVKYNFALPSESLRKQFAFKWIKKTRDSASEVENLFVRSDDEAIAGDMRAGRSLSSKNRKSLYHHPIAITSDHCPIPLRPDLFHSSYATPTTSPSTPNPEETKLTFTATLPAESRTRSEPSSMSSLSSLDAPIPDLDLRSSPISIPSTSTFGHRAIPNDIVPPCPIIPPFHTQAQTWFSRFANPGVLLHFYNTLFYTPYPGPTLSLPTGSPSSTHAVSDHPISAGYCLIFAWGQPIEW